MNQNDVFYKTLRCGHCKRLEPTWKELGKNFKDDKQVTIARVSRFLLMIFENLINTGIYIVIHLCYLNICMFPYVLRYFFSLDFIISFAKQVTYIEIFSLMYIVQ